MRDQHPLSGKTVRLNDTASDHTQNAVVPGALYRIEDWLINVSGGRSWRDTVGNWAVRHYGARVERNGLPFDDEVVYGKIDGLGHAVHVSELGEVVETSGR